LEVLLDNSSSITLNLKPRLGTIRFNALTDPEFFGKATTDGSFIRWEGQGRDLGQLFQLAQK
jgi:hypothetical protein